MEKRQKNLARASIISSIIGIITLIGIFCKLAVTRANFEELTDFKQKQEVINQTTSNQFTQINTKLDMIMDYFEISPKK